jgi:hypothetical protein
LGSPVDPAEFKRKINAELPEGIEVRDVVEC